ncbi:MAG: metallophosphoesterase family protein [Paracoccaceae bacterium]
MTDPIYAIGDIHGQLSMLETALARIESDGGPDAQIVFLGDYTDRGPDSRGVLNLLVQGQKQGRNWTFLKGNHDRMMEWFLGDPPRQDPHLLVGYHWFHDRLGGIETLQSYGIDQIEGRRQTELATEARATVPTDHLTFLRGLHLSHTQGPLFFAHAGIRPGVPLDQQAENDLLWIRQEFHNDPRDHGPLIVHGHTPVEGPTHYGNRVNLDSGAGYGYPLTTAVFEGRDCWTLTDTGRKPLLPD